MTIVTIDIDGNTYQSYATVADADERLLVDASRGVAWGKLTPRARGVALVGATRRLDLMDWAGAKAGGDDSQELAWPRTGVTYPDGTAVASVGVPSAVRDATILLAGTMVTVPAAGDAGSSSSNIKSVGAGSARVEFFRPTQGVALRDETAYALLAPFLAATAGGVVSGACVTGNEGTSSFTDATYPGLTEAFP